MSKVYIQDGVFQIPCVPHCIVAMRDGDAILTVNHNDAELIYHKFKSVLLTSFRPSLHLGTNLWFYETYPIGRITGQAIYGGLTVFPKCYVPGKVLKMACTTPNDIDRQYCGKLWVPTIRIIDPRRLQTPITLYNIGLQFEPYDYAIVNLAKQIPSAVL